MSRPSAWAMGWAMFAGTMMVLMGMWWVIAGLVAVLDDAFYVITREWIFEFDTTAWGWTHMILGIVVSLAGFGMFRGVVWARTVGVVIAVVSALIAFAWLPYYPIWAILFVAVSVAIIWSLTAHGDEFATSA
jgi:hypothetical protein